MNLNNYLPLNSQKSIDLLITDIQSGAFKISSKEQIGIEIIYNIRKVKLQIYFKERMTDISVISNPSNFNTEKKNTISDTSKLPLKPKNKKKYPKGKKILILDNSESTNSLNNESPQPKKEKRKKRNEIAILGIVQHDRLLLMTIAELSVELKWKPTVLLTILKQKGINKDEIEKLNSDEYSIVKEVINHRILQLRRQLKQENWVLDSRIRKKCEKPGYAAKKSGVFDEIAKYGLGKLIYIKSK